MSPGVANLFELLKACGKTDIYNSLMGDYNAGQLKYSVLKEAVADSLVELSSKFIARKEELNRDSRAVEERVHEMSQKARVIAKETVREVRELTGLPQRKD